MKKSQWKRKIWIWNVKSYVIGLGIPSNFENLPDLKHNFNLQFNFPMQSLNHVCPAELRCNASGTTTFLWSTHCHVVRTVNKILNRNGFVEGNDTNQGHYVFLFY